MVKTLLNKIGKKVRNGVLVATAVASLGFAGCKLPGNDPPVPPTPPDPTLPIITLNNKNVTEGQSVPVDLSQYKDSCGNSVTWENIINYDNQSFLTPTLNGNQLTVSVNNSVDKDYPYQIDLKFKDNVNGKENKASLEGVIENLIDISGTSGILQDNETHSPQIGTIKIYDSNNNQLISVDNTSGSFGPIKTNMKASDLPNGIKIKAAMGSPGNYTSYVRTINKSVTGDITLIDLIRVVPYGIGWTQTEINNFIEHMRRVNFWNGGLEKWNHGELPDDSSTTYSHPIFKGIQISNNFLSVEQDDIENAIRNSGHLKAGEINIVRGENHYLELGWGFIRLSNPGEAPGTYVYEQYGSDGYIERFLTNLDHLQATDNGLVNHEVVGHGMLFLGESDAYYTSNNIILLPVLFNSIMRYTSYDTRYSPPKRPDVFTPIDVKGNYLIDESTYKGM